MGWTFLSGIPVRSDQYLKFQYKGVHIFARLPKVISDGFRRECGSVNPKGHSFLTQISDILELTVTGLVFLVRTGYLKGFWNETYTH